jgi:hypothetical protein
MVIRFIDFEFIIGIALWHVYAQSLKITVSEASISAKGPFPNFTYLNERYSPTDSDGLVWTNRY